MTHNGNKIYCVSPSTTGAKGRLASGQGDLSEVARANQVRCLSTPGGGVMPSHPVAPTGYVSPLMRPANKNLSPQGVPSPLWRNTRKNRDDARLSARVRRGRAEDQRNGLTDTHTLWSRHLEREAVLRKEQELSKGVTVQAPTQPGQRKDSSGVKPRGFGALNPDESLEDGCQVKPALRGRALAVIEMMATEFKRYPARPLRDFDCGGLYAAVREVFPEDLDEVEELSIKTARKLEVSVCSVCETRHKGLIEEWKEARFRPQVVDADHLRDFAKAFSNNVEKGWNRRVYPFIPNGHATFSTSRREGGNWNEESFEGSCRPVVVISSGKPRVITLFSEYNTRILTPLHLSLYASLKKRGWLLVGSPTHCQVEALTGEGEYVSVDYQSATDNIKTAYVRQAVECLLSKGEGLTEEERKCLRVLGELRLDPDGPVAESGQPMGSVMSFPLLCIINKTVQDMALSALLSQGKIRFREWTGHRCLINGDDVLTREPRRESPGMLKAQILKHGTSVGLKLNPDKTMVSATKGEINSTLFIDHGGTDQAVNAFPDPFPSPPRVEKVPKTNFGALFMRPEVDDVLGFAFESTTTLQGFLKVVRRNAHILAKQDDKRMYLLPWELRVACSKDRRIRGALLKGPVSQRPVGVNRFPVSPRPEGYDLSRQEETDIINQKVRDIREKVDDFSVKRTVFRTSAVRRPGSVLTVMRQKKPRGMDDTVLTILARAWERKTKETLFQNEGYVLERPEYDCLGILDVSPIQGLVDMIRSARSKPKDRPLLTEADNEMLRDYIAFDWEQ